MKKPKKKPTLNKYYTCWDCAKEMGGEWPEGHCATVMKGTCEYCGKCDTIVPVVDFNFKGYDRYRLLRD